MTKKYPKEFKKYIKTEYGKILETEKCRYRINPAVYNKYGTPLPQFGFLVSYDSQFADGFGHIVIDDLIVETADTLEELQ